MKKILSIFLVLAMVLVIAGCGNDKNDKASHAELKPYLDDLYDANKTISTSFNIPPNFPLKSFCFEGTVTTKSDETIDIFEGKELQAGQSIVLDNPDDIKAIQITVYEIINGEKYPGITWEIDIPNHSAKVGFK